MPVFESPFARAGTSVFEVMSRLAIAAEAVNLGQGFPDDRGDPALLAKAAAALLEGSNQYPPMLGLPALRAAIAAHERHWYGLDLDPASGVVVTSGATEALAAAILALVDPGDEVVLFAPFYDAYLPMVRRAGGVPRFVRLGPPDWRVDPEALAAAFSPRTKAVILNNPLNPAAKVFAPEELQMLARLIETHDAIAICDEVYEHIVFDGAAHRPLINEPGMARRCIKIGSAGKSFSLTGWKVGWAVGDPELIGKLARAHQFLTFTTPPNLQAAVAFGLDAGPAALAALGVEMQRRRDRFVAGLARIGIPALPAAGTYFVNVDIAATGLAHPGETDEAFCRRLIAEAGVAAIPLSAFYAEAPVTSVVRFCIAKQDGVLDAALARLANLVPCRGSARAAAE